MEEVTEKLSEQVARPYLRTPRTVIMQTTALTRKRRHEFVKAIDKGLAPPETPPEQRRVRKIFFINSALYYAVFQSQMAQAMAKNWIRDVQANPALNSIFDWPRFETDQEVVFISASNGVSNPLIFIFRRLMLIKPLQLV